MTHQTGYKVQQNNPSTRVPSCAVSPCPDRRWGCSASLRRNSHASSNTHRGTSAAATVANLLQTNPSHGIVCLLHEPNSRRSLQHRSPYPTQDAPAQRQRPPHPTTRLNPSLLLSPARLHLHLRPRQVVHHHPPPGPARHRRRAHRITIPTRSVSPPAWRR